MLPALAAGLAACQGAQALRREADEEVYALIQARRTELFGDAEPLQVEPPAGSLRQRLLAGEAPEQATLSLVDCLGIAAENSRDYQSRRETLYRSALDLTLEQWRFGWIPEAGADATVSGDGEGAQEARAAGNLAFQRTLGTGAQIVANLGASLFRLLSTGDGWDALSSIGLSVTQPLLRGAGSEVTLEPLTQAQRDLVYAVRDYERFRRTFAVEVAQQYYRLLQALDALENERENVRALEDLRRRNEALGEAGRLSDIQVDQARQDELRSRNRLIELQQSLEAQLDDFKFFLGLPIQASIALDPGEVERRPVSEADRLPADAAERLIGFALERRLDYRNTTDQVEDAARQVRIAADALRAGLDLVATTDAASEEGRPLGYRARNLGWEAGVVLDLPVDRTPERNALRAADLALQAAARAVEAQGDSIRSNVRDRVRQVLAARESYEVQRNAVALAERRVQSANLNLQAGRSSTRDVLEAQADVLAARNALTAAQIAYILAWLQLYSELELLEVDETGIVTDNETLAGLLSEGA